MIEKRLKKLWKLTVLIGVRQLYFLGRNWYLLWSSPYLTVKEIKDKRDKSQIFLVGLSALSPAIFYVLLRIIWDLVFYQRLLFMTGRVFLVAAMIQIAVLAYLGYWIFMVYKKEE
jgi:hypothetical protein